MFITDIRLFFEARNLSVEVVRADDESKQGYYCVPFFGGIESSRVFQMSLIYWLRARCKKQACMSSNFALSFHVVDDHPLSSHAHNRPWLHMQRDLGLEMEFPIPEE